MASWRLFAPLAFLSVSTRVVEGTSSCQGGSLASCQCLLGCSIFDSSPKMCDAGGDVAGLVTRAVTGAQQRNGSETACRGMQCVVSCASRLGCLSSKIKALCGKAIYQNPRCHLDCNSSHRAADPRGAPLLLAAAWALLTALVAAAADGR
mmetsp:Transcript_88434/g.245556  ORF Transcript_88434/g.245556 Transcript_88434/m.245556 type:complete len:150 (-) Transcript_88434:141-590(-)